MYEVDFCLYSLNYIKRQREAERVARENQVRYTSEWTLTASDQKAPVLLQAILRRLQTVRPQYNTKGWVCPPTYTLTTSARLLTDLYPLSLLGR